MKQKLQIDWGFLGKNCLLILLFSYLMLFASTHNGLVDERVLRISFAISASCVILLFLSKVDSIGKIWIPVSMFFAILLLSVAFSIDPRRSITEVWLLGQAFFCFFMVTFIRRKGWQAEIIIRSLLMVGLIIMVFNWMELIAWFQNWLSVTGKLIPDVNYRLDIPNFMGVLLNLLTMMAVGQLISAKKLAERLILGLWILSSLILLFFTSSRGGWLGTIAGLGTIAVFYIQENKAMLDKIWLRIRSRKIVLIGGGMLVFLLVAGAGYVLYQQTLHPSHGSILGSRKILWGPAWEAIKASPFIGQGPYTFISAFMQQNSVPPQHLYVYAHSIYLDVLMSSGMIGFAAFLWLLVRFVKGMLEKYHQLSGADRWVVISAFGALAAFLAHGIFDSVHHTIPTSAWVLAICLGTAYGFQKESKNSGKTPWPEIILGLMVLLGSILNLWQLRPYSQGVRFANVGNFEGAAHAFEDAFKRDPKNAMAYQQLGLSYSYLDDNWLKEAISAFEKTVEIDSYWAENHLNLGALHMAAGDYSKAVEILSHSVAAAPNCSICHLNLGLAQEMSGDQTAAIGTYQQALNNDAQKGTAYFWRTSPVREEAYRIWAEEVSGPELKVEDIRRQIEKDPARLSNYLELVERLLEQGKLSEAQSAIDQANLAYSNSAREMIERDWFSAEITALSGDYDSAVDQGSSVVRRYLQQDIYGMGSSEAVYYGPLMFRRLAMVQTLVPQVSTIALTDEWGDRLTKLASWYQLLGDYNQAESLLNEVSAMIPDYQKPDEPTLEKE
jgi:putative inorganic carbon (HCO3(-)) transporter